MKITPAAESLNSILQENCPAVYNLLSEKGRAIFFPKQGILAQTAQAKGAKINATIGSAKEDDGSIMRLGCYADKVSLDPELVFPYAPSYGRADLRAKWQELIKSKNPSLKGEISLPVVTNALTHGLSLMGYMFLNPGEKLIMPDLFWGNYKLIFSAGFDAEIDTFPTFVDGGFNVQGLKDALTQAPGKKVVVLNFPNNPSGYTPTTDEYNGIIDAVKAGAQAGSQIAAICDDSYFGLVYEDGIARESIFAELADLHENVLAIKIDGATKEDFVWGLRVGFITAAIKGAGTDVLSAFADKLSGAVRGGISNVSNLSQNLVLQAVNSGDYQSQKKEKFEILQSRYQLVKEVLTEKKYAKYFTALPYNSGYFMCVQLADGLEAEAVRQKLLEDYSTGVIATGNLLRVAYSSMPGEQVAELFENIFKACESL